MKKTLLSIAILASSIFAFANTNTPSQSSPSTSTEQTAPSDGKKGDRKGSSAEGRRAAEDRLFEGIDLTDNQKERLAALKEKNKADRQAAKKAGKARGENLTPEQRDQMKAQRAFGRRAFLAGVKEILTPEQYITFLENSFSLDRDNHKMHKAHKGDKKRPGGDKKKHGRKNAPSAKKGSKADNSRS